MDSLIAKLEAASEGSRELDALVLNEIRRQEDPEMVLTEEQIIKGIAAHDEYHPNYQEQLPHYTTSLDAALTLVPGGDYDQSWHKSTRGDERHRLWQVRIALKTVRDDPDETGPVELGQADTPALALCIASLRARKGGAG